MASKVNADHKLDKILGIKQGSPADNKKDKASGVFDKERGMMKGSKKQK